MVNRRAHRVESPTGRRRGEPHQHPGSEAWDDNPVDLEFHLAECPHPADRSRVSRNRVNHNHNRVNRPVRRRDDRVRRKTVPLFVDPPDSHRARPDSRRATAPHHRARDRNNLSHNSLSRVRDPYRRGMCRPRSATTGDIRLRRRNDR